MRTVGTNEQDGSRVIPTLRLPNGELWEQHSRREQSVTFKRRRTTIFYEKWVHRPSMSGISFFSAPKGKTIIYQIEGHGVGTINPDTFTARQDGTPIQLYTEHDETSGRERLTRLILENTQLWIDCERRVAPESPTGTLVSLEDAMKDPHIREAMHEFVGNLPENTDRDSIRKVMDAAERSNESEEPPATRI